MAQKGPMPKHPSKRQRRNSPQMSVVSGGKMEKPGYQRQWFKVTREGWDAFWESDVAAAVGPEDLGALRRLFNLRDDHERLSRSARKQPFITGSQGQLVENPAAKRADRIMGEITRLEDKFGLNPAARMRLAVSTADVQRTVSDLTIGMQRDDDPLQIIDVDSNAAR